MAATVLPVATRALVEACGRLGLDPDRLLARAGIERARLEDPDSRLEAGQADAVWREALLASGDPALALRAAEQTPFGAFRVLDYLGASGATVGEGLRRVAAYFPLVDPRAALAVEEEAGGAVSLVFRAVGGGALPPQAQEYTLAILASRVRQVTRAPRPELGFRFTFSRPAHAAEHARVLGVEPAYGAPVAALVLSRATWDAPTSGGDPRLLAALDEHARALLGRASGGDGAARTRAAIWAELTGREPSLAAVARRLGTSPRTLQRRLEEEGTRFAAEVDRVRRERAESLLTAPDVAIAEVSWLVGFAEQSAFTRAFRRWTGTSPSAWRREHAGSVPGRATRPR
ncbi:AraC family transcriptional regulator [Anaeromyxobacter oryzisoli]|uniref:AraC family transcriptional regulator n=1 Tax=Anaeromyxobacter oryzisoli TaxID=2925408 RepID=UPI001F5A92C4|nr:AraC family transcriptional regulator [Anaeromyxobacter sp. SG63]